MSTVKTSNIEYSGILMVAFGIIGLFQGASAIMTARPLNVVPLFITANALEAVAGWLLLVGKHKLLYLAIAANIFLIAARAVALASSGIGALELVLWIFLVLVTISLFRERPKSR